MFLDTDIDTYNIKTTILTSVHIQKAKLPTGWVSKVPKPYKRNSIVGDLHRANCIESNFDREVNYPPRYVNSIIR